MKNFRYRLTCLFVLFFLVSRMAMAQTTDKTRSTVPGHSGYNHVNSQDNWGLFGIIGVIALAGLTKRNVVEKN